MPSNSKYLYPKGIYLSNTKNPLMQTIAINPSKFIEWIEENPGVVNEKGVVSLCAYQNSPAVKARMIYPKDTAIYFPTENLRDVSERKEEEQPSSYEEMQRMGLIPKKEDNFDDLPF